MRSPNSAAWIDLIKAELQEAKEKRENQSTYLRQLNMQKKLLAARRAQGLTA